MTSSNVVKVSALIFLVLVTSQVSSRPQELEEQQRSLVGYPGSIYSFPFLCTLAYGSSGAAHYISACTIVQKKFAVASLDSMNVEVPRDVHGVKFWFQALSNLHVLTGPHQLHPDVGSEWYGQDKPQIHDESKPGEHRADVYKVINVHIPILDNLESENITSVKSNLDSYGDLVFGAYGLAMNLGLIETVGFVWSLYTLPAPLRSFDKHKLRRMEWDHINSLEYHSSSQTSCVVGSWESVSRTLTYHSVIFVRKQECKESYCAHDIRSCMKFPLNPNTVCFKSVLYSDLCPADRGSALYCDSFGKSVFAVLTTALNCGAKNLPCVYTLASKLVELVKLVQGKMDDPIDYSKYAVVPGEV